jgi:hypothetical protein
MKPFHTIAIPHDDILKKKLTMNVFAADLWDTFKNRGPEEYTDSETFFNKTHMTKSLRIILDGVKEKLEGKGGDGFQHVETPFGGGKTHALIAMYHSAKDWGAKPVVIVGTAMGPDDTVWGIIEKQLDGKIEKLAGKLAPGREALREVLDKHPSVLILIDELLPYVTTAAGVELKDTTLATQTITFIQQLSEVTSTLERVCVVASFPASVVEMADQKTAEELLRKIRKVAGRKERKITPVDPNDVPNIIRSRLFSTKEKEIEANANSIISDFVDYCEKEQILPPNKSAKQYKNDFTKSYPFLPQVIDTLYQNWGSFESFQRTRGVLRLLSLVVYSLKDSQRPFITLADFDLNDNEIRRELLNHIGNPFDSVITKDITDDDSGASRVSQEIGTSYRGLKLGTKTATTIFMCSFSGAESSGANMGEIKRAVAFQEIPSSIIGDVVANFKSKLFYLRSEDDRYLFSSEPNINRLKMDRMENIKDHELLENEKNLIESNIGKQKLRVKIWPQNSSDIEDSHQLKLVILPDNNKKTCNNILEQKGESPRVNRNSIFFLCPSDGEKTSFTESLKSKIALEKILSDRLLKLKDAQKKDITEELKKEKNKLTQLIKKYYRLLYIPNKNELKDYDMGIPTVGENRGIDDEVYERLLTEQQVHENIGPLIIKNDYLKDHTFAKTSQMYGSMLSTRGSRRPVSENVIINSLQRGIVDGIFGLGELIDEQPSCKYFKEEPSISFADNEVIIQDSICISQIKKLEEPSSLVPGEEEPPISEPESLPDNAQDSLDFGFQIPGKKMNDVWPILRLINEKFNSIELDIKAKDGTISKNDIEKIREALKQIGAFSNL